jgi:hypothetical protein
MQKVEEQNMAPLYEILCKVSKYFFLLFMVSGVIFKPSP